MTREPPFVTEPTPGGTAGDGGTASTRRFGNIVARTISCDRPAAWPLQRYPHRSIIYVQAGQLMVGMEGEVRTLVAGDGVVVPPDVEYSLEAPQAGARIVRVWYPVDEAESHPHPS